jgi:hypothetical protein
LPIGGLLIYIINCLQAPQLLVCVILRLPFVLGVFYAKLLSTSIFCALLFLPAKQMAQ